jgi:hypothetical protein
MHFLYPNFVKCQGVFLSKYMRAAGECILRDCRSTDTFFAKGVID